MPVAATGVCDGNDASGVQSVTMSAQLSSTYTQSELDDPLSPARITIDAAISSTIGGLLDRPTDKVTVTAVTLVTRRRQLSSRALASSVSIQTELLPFGGANNLPQVRPVCLLSSCHLVLLSACPLVLLSCCATSVKWLGGGPLVWLDM